MNLSLLITVDRGECAHDECGECPFRTFYDFGDDNAPEHCTNPAWGPFDKPVINGKRTPSCLAAEAKDERS